MDEMTKALIADGKKLRQLTGKNHGPKFPCSYCDGTGSICLACQQVLDDCQCYEKFEPASCEHCNGHGSLPFGDDAEEG